ncbi:uncharacterized protein LOC127283760 isoform X2 [Leptopilina boulardi]|uniref:uncharacterized protein LOC127283760 isoform X2 n=1 Tax=Leptopilina boulardi TaxID=63433 RepID=UPI0021F68DCA|nr:uncharacterized protein LOC127283760 isoform X2 [Leptopilina boulardi]
MAPRRRPIYQDENTTSDEMSDSTYQPLQPLHKRARIRTNNHNNMMADEILREGVVVKKRGRGPSKRPCLNRNAQMARENRQKKKEYIEKIENKLQQLQHENKNLTTVIKQQNIDIKKLNADVSYLKSVLNNKSSITILLRSMNENLEKIQHNKIQQKTTILHRQNENNKDSLDFVPAENKLLFNDDYRIKLENENGKITNNDSYQLLAEAYRMNNNLSKSDEEEELFHDTRQEKNNFKNHLPITPDSLNDKISDDHPSTTTFNEMDFNDFSNFSTNNIFDDLGKFDDMTLDFDQVSTTCATIDEDFFQGLDENSGICLHVNPNRVSLEFCSSCQMNSANPILE